MYIVTKNGYGYLSLMGVYSDAAAIRYVKKMNKGGGNIIAKGL